MIQDGWNLERSLLSTIKHHVAITSKLKKFYLARYMYTICFALCQNYICKYTISFKPGLAQVQINVNIERTTRIVVKLFWEFSPNTVWSNSHKVHSTWLSLETKILYFKAGPIFCYFWSEYIYPIMTFCTFILRSDYCLFAIVFVTPLSSFFWRYMTMNAMKLIYSLWAYFGSYHWV